jgi:hypothetical protein
MEAARGMLLHDEAASGAGACCGRRGRLRRAREIALARIFG